MTRRAYALIGWTLALIVLSIFWGSVIAFLKNWLHLW